MSDMSNYLEDALANHVFRNTSLTSPTTVYVALFTAVALMSLNPPAKGSVYEERGLLVL